MVRIRAQQGPPTPCTRTHTHTHTQTHTHVWVCNSFTAHTRTARGTGTWGARAHTPTHTERQRVRETRTCSVPFSAQKKQNQASDVPKPNAMLTSAVVMRPPANRMVGEKRAPNTPLTNLLIPYLCTHGSANTGTHILYTMLACTLGTGATQALRKSQHPAVGLPACACLSAHVA